MKVSDFDYYLPQQLIAQTPAEPRDSSRLLVYNRAVGSVEHKYFHDVIDYLDENDVLVINDTRVLPARLFGIKEGTAATVEFLLLERKDRDTWLVMVKPGRRLKPGVWVSFGEGKLRAEILSSDEEGNRLVRFVYNGIFEELLDALGHMPLPPYITQKLEDKDRYQTVYAVYNGSAAAPTAGLHFTPQLLEVIRDKGVTIAPLTLHVGLGTFRPVKAENIQEHKMHSEYYMLSQQTAEAINKAKSEGKRIIAVGTTAARVLETAAEADGTVRGACGWTDIFIYPGYKWKNVDALITNFHLPRSTLLMLVSAFIGREQTLKVYETAVKLQYRFFSFGDAMLLL